jgi:hypothetical protein
MRLKQVYNKTFTAGHSCRNSKLYCGSCAQCNQ